MLAELLVEMVSLWVRLVVVEVMSVGFNSLEEVEVMDIPTGLRVAE